MLRGPLHNRGADGLCEACGEPFPCPDGLAIYEAVKRELNVAHRVEPHDELLERAQPFEPEPSGEQRPEGRYQVRFVKNVSSGSVEPRVITHARIGDVQVLIWRPSRNPDGDGCYEHYEHEPIEHDDHSPRA